MSKTRLTEVQIAANEAAYDSGYDRALSDAEEYSAISSDCPVEYLPGSYERLGYLAAMRDLCK